MKQIFVQRGSLELRVPIGDIAAQRLEAAKVIYYAENENLPQFPPSLPDEDLAFLRGLSPGPGEWDLLNWNQWAVARRLERRGLVKISRYEGDLWAQKTPAASLRLQN